MVHDVKMWHHASVNAAPCQLYAGSRFFCLFTPNAIQNFPFSTKLTQNISIFNSKNWGLSYENPIIWSDLVCRFFPLIFEKKFKKIDFFPISVKLLTVFGVSMLR